MPVRYILRTLLTSIAILSGLGVLQVLVFIPTGTDLFPVGMFVTESRSAFVTIQHEFFLRASSFAGEPKGLGMVAAAGAVIVLGFRQSLVPSGAWRFTLVMLFVVTVILTQSTSAVLSLIVGVTTIIGLRVIGKPLTRAGLFMTFFTATAVLATLILISASNLDVESGRLFAKPDASFFQLVVDRTLGRLNVDDFDWVIISSMLHDPSSLFLGHGFGLSHLFTEPFIPAPWRRYMLEIVIAPKSGLLFFISSGGIVATFLFVLFLAYTTPAVRPKVRLTDPIRWHYVRMVQVVVIPLVLMALMRVQIYELSLLVLALVSVRTSKSARATPKGHSVEFSRLRGRLHASRP